VTGVPAPVITVEGDPITVCVGLRDTGTAMRTLEPEESVVVMVTTVSVGAVMEAVKEYWMFLVVVGDVEDGEAVIVAVNVALAWLSALMTASLGSGEPANWHTNCTAVRRRLVSSPSSQLEFAHLSTSGRKFPEASLQMQ